MPFTASYTDVWTIAATRVAGGGGVCETSSASTIVLFQSVTTSAAAACGAASAANAISATANLGLIFVCIAAPFSRGVLRRGAWPRTLRKG
jgi:hypothetical protein